MKTINTQNYLTVSAYQGSVEEGNPKINFENLLKIMYEAESRKVDILCLPESYLHGYFPTQEQALQHSLELDSPEFRNICQQLEPFQHTTLLLGLNEKYNDKVFNTVVVIEKGQYLGKYQKAYTYPPYDYYSLGREFPVFEKKGIKYSIIICLDSVYREPALISALNGAQIIFCPMFNRAHKADTRILNYLGSKSHFVSRAFDNQCWLVASDIVWDKNDDQVCPGYATILDDNGQLVAQAQAFQEMLLIYAIPMALLTSATAFKRRLGNQELFDQVKLAYDKALSKK